MGQGRFAPAWALAAAGLMLAPAQAAPQICAEPQAIRPLSGQDFSGNASQKPSGNPSPNPPQPLDGSPQPGPVQPRVGGPGDYRQQLRPTPFGWPIRSHWCVWIEPGASTGPAARWDQRWLAALDAALKSWEQLLPISRVSNPSQAQVLVWRRRPPLRHNRASHGRAELELRQVQSDGRWQIDPLVTVLISPGQAQPALQATALHELGHAFGLWGHSDQGGDVMAVSPGGRPLLQFSPRDIATLDWLYRQSGLPQPQASSSLIPGAGPPAAGPAPPAPGAN